MDFDLILEHLGHFGKFQCFVMIFAGVAQIFSGMQMHSGVFLTPMDKFSLKTARCRIPNCDTNLTKFDEAFVKFAIPNVSDETGVHPKPCQRYANIPGEHYCGPGAFNVSKTIYCPGYVWDPEEFKSTALTEFDLVCQTTLNGVLSNVIFMTGVLVGSAGFGVIADKFGRRIAMLIASVVMLLSSITTYFADGFVTFSLLRFITAIAVSGLFQTSYILVVEFVGTSKRLVCANLLQIIFAIGELILGLVAHFVQKWRILELIISAPAALLLIYYWLPESVRWLISRQKWRGAEEIIKKAEKWNRTIPYDLFQTPMFDIASPPVGPMSLIKTPRIRWWSLNLFLCWFVNALVYYGLSLSDKTYIRFAVLAIIEIVAIVLATVALLYFGRRKVLCFVMVFGGIACCFTAVVQGLPWMATILTVLGKGAISASFAIIFLYSAEIYPTTLRCTGIGFCSVSARFGGMIAPLISGLRTVYSRCL